MMNQDVVIYVRNGRVESVLSSDTNIDVTIVDDDEMRGHETLEEVCEYIKEIHGIECLSEIY